MLEEPSGTIPTSDVGRIIGQSDSLFKAKKELAGQVTGKGWAALWLVQPCFQKKR